jgi:carboxylesterase type B
LSKVAAEIAPREQQTPEGFGAFHMAEIEKWWSNHQGGRDQSGMWRSH